MSGKRYVLTGLLLLVPFFLRAQMAVGVYTGINNSKLRGDIPEKFYYLNLPNWDGGIRLDWKVNGQLTLSFQPYLTRKGTKVSYRVDPQLDPVDTAKIYLSFISFPVIVDVFTQGGKWYVLGGAELAKPLRSYYRLIGGEGEKYDIGDHVTSFNVYILFGVGYRHSIGSKMKLFVEARYFQALINTILAGTIDPVEIPRVRSRGTQLEVGMLMPLSFGKEKEK